MNFDLKKLDLDAAASEKCDLLAVLVTEEFKAGKDPLSALAGQAIKQGDFSAKLGKVLQCYNAPAAVARRVVLLGAGDGSARAVRQAVLSLSSLLKGPQVKRMVVASSAALSGPAVCALVQAVAEAMTMAGLEVEEVHDPIASLAPFTVARIVSAARHPNADRLQLCQVDVGNLVAANDTTFLAVITQTQPISVVFTLPENSLETVLARYHSGARLPAEAWDRGDTKIQASGVLQSLDNQIDVATGTLKFKARYDNRDQSLFPNQFVNVHLLADTLKGVVLAPSAAIQFGTNGTFVYALDGDKKVTIRQLKIGASDGTNTVVTEGLAAGDRVVLEGTDRLKEGSEVEVVNDSNDVPTTPTGHLQGKPAASAPDAATADKAKKGA